MSKSCCRSVFDNETTDCVAFHNKSHYDGTRHDTREFGDESIDEAFLELELISTNYKYCIIAIVGGAAVVVVLLVCEVA